MASCTECGKSSGQIAHILSLCADCIRAADSERLTRLRRIHADSRRPFDLPGGPVSAPKGVRCRLCRNACRIGTGERGYCGIRTNRNGRLAGGTPRGAAVSWYHDPLPTNCVADWVCPGGTGAGYPQWAYSRRAEHGYLNLAVFYQACTFNCLFCQNWHYRQHSPGERTHAARELAEAVSAETSCICFFGGDPTPQLPHAIAAAKLARKRNANRILRICWETNGAMSPQMLDRMLNLSLESGGCIKFDLKAINSNIHLALCGVGNRRTLRNFAAAAGRMCERPRPPLLVASTLLVPGYIDAAEVGAIASFIAELGVNIPYALLAFHGDFLMADLPATSRRDAEACLAAARAAGLKNVRLGNTHLLR